MASMNPPKPPQQSSVSLKELWMLLGEKDVQIYQLLKMNELLLRELEILKTQKPEL